MKTELTIYRILLTISACAFIWIGLQSLGKDNMEVDGCGDIVYPDGRPYIIESDTMHIYWNRDQLKQYHYWTKNFGLNNKYDTTVITYFLEVRPEEFKRIWWALEYEDEEFGFGDRITKKEYKYTFKDGYVVWVVDGKRINGGNE